MIHCPTAGLTGDIPIQSNTEEEKQFNTEVAHHCPLQAAGNLEDDELCVLIISNYLSNCCQVNYNFAILKPLF